MNFVFALAFAILVDAAAHPDDGADGWNAGWQAGGGH